MATRKRGGKKREVEKGVRVSAVTSSHGPPATTVNVEVERAALEEDAGPVGEVKRVQAELPEEREGGEVHWSRAELRKVGEERRREGDTERSVQRYAATHLGPTDARRHGVSVDVETESGTLRAPARSEAYAVRESDQPRRAERLPARPRKKPER